MANVKDTPKAPAPVPKAPADPLEEFKTKLPNGLTVYNFNR